MNTKVLIVDDEFDDLLSMKEILEKEGMKVFTATNGAKALDLLNENQFDIILIDIKMPTLSGYDLLRLLKERVDSKSKILFVSIIPEKEADLSECDGFIQKPFSPKSIVSKIKSVLN
ncbi:MAG: response regulator [Candidatus Diapherotrites archaeon]|nr:response regulator [Candidatus Diapherotrites archaeon]